MTTLGPSGTQFRAPGTKAVVARLPVGTGAGAARWALAALRCLYSSSTSRQKLELGGATIIGVSAPRLDLGLGIAGAAAAAPLSSRGVCPVAVGSEDQPSGPTSS